MKRLMIGLLAAVLCFSVKAQVDMTREETVTIPKSMLSERGLEIAESKMNAAKPWLGIGKEFAIGLNGAVDVLKSNAYEFASTPMGKATIVVVAYKIIGHDILRTGLGITTGVCFILIGFKCLRKAKGTELYVKAKTGFWIFGTKEYAERKTDPDWLQEWHTGIGIIYTRIGIISLIAGAIYLIVTVTNI